MEKIPLQLRLKREIHRKVAYAQDIAVKEVYSIINNSVLHGGTSIWRCYSGNRFSEDLDFYFPESSNKIEMLFENLKKIGFEIKKKKITKNSLYSELEINRTSIRLEGIFKRIKGILCDYEKIDGSIISIYSLSIEELIKEKIKAYLKRLKIRDLWDVFFLTKKIDNLNKIKEIGELIKNYKKPIDEENLKAIILEGVIPPSQDMIEYLKRKWERKNI